MHYHAERAGLKHELQPLLECFGLAAQRLPARGRAPFLGKIQPRIKRFERPRTCRSEMSPATATAGRLAKKLLGRHRLNKRLLNRYYQITWSRNTNSCTP